MAAASQFQLLRERRFLPFFITQALGAFNDNVFKNALVILATFQAASYGGLKPELLANIAGGVFILPFVLFSGFAGQLADRFDKTLVLKCVKAMEIAFMLLASIGFLRHRIALLFASLFLMGMHSTFFAPAKYGLLPQVLSSAELIGGNAMLEVGTFLAILLGTLLAGVLAGQSSTAWISAALLGVALIGFAASLAIPRAAAVAPEQRLDWNPWTSTVENLKTAAESRAVLLSLLGLSWFWFYGALVLAQLPLYCRSILHGDAALVTLTLAVFSVGVGIGSLLCERLSGGTVEIGLVPFGSIGLSAFAFDWVLASSHLPQAASFTVGSLAASWGGLRILFDIGAIGIFGGFFVVPLYALVQQRARPEALSRVIGANSILNALFMVAAALIGAFALDHGFTVLHVLLAAGLLNAAVAVYIYALVPEFLLRFAAWILAHSIYRLDKRGAERIPENGPALIVCNHISFVDALLVSASSRRPIRFIMEAAIFRVPVIQTIASGMKAIPIASSREEPEVYERAFARVAEQLRAGELVCIFPEGRLTEDGELGEFRPGLLRILSETPVPVVPMAVCGLWGSMFSRQSKSVWRRLPRKLWSRIYVRVGEPVEPIDATPGRLREIVLALRAGLPL
jgi:1-acyl-sn-glycerol-3-phosphate acyltransferase